MDFIYFFDGLFAQMDQNWDSVTIAQLFEDLIPTQESNPGLFIERNFKNSTAK
jgi:hypothetical protein